MIAEKRVTRLGCNPERCTLLVQYKQLPEDLVFTKRIRIKRSRCMSADQLANELIKVFPELLSADSVPRGQAVRPIFAARGIDGENDADEPALDAENLKEIDLNKCSDELNLKAKQLMNQHFEVTRLKPGDEGFEYDRRTDFVATESNEWDDDEDDDE